MEWSEFFIHQHNVWPSVNDFLWSCFDPPNAQMMVMDYGLHRKWPLVYHTKFIWYVSMWYFQQDYIIFHPIFSLIIGAICGIKQEPTNIVHLTTSYVVQPPYDFTQPSVLWNLVAVPLNVRWLVLATWPIKPWWDVSNRCRIWEGDNGCGTVWKYTTDTNYRSCNITLLGSQQTPLWNTGVNNVGLLT